MARSGRQDNLECKVFIGDLPRDAEEREIERSFTRFGTIKSVWVARNPPGFAFVEYEDSRDAEDAVREMDGTTICGVRARVEHATGKKRRERDSGRGGSGGYGGGGGGGRYRGGGDRSSGNRRSFNPDDRCYVCGESGHYAYDCPSKNGKDRGSGGRYSKRSRSRSRSRNGRSYSRSYSR